MLCAVFNEKFRKSLFCNAIAFNGDKIRVTNSSSGKIFARSSCVMRLAGGEEVAKNSLTAFKRTLKTFDGQFHPQSKQVNSMRFGQSQPRVEVKHLHACLLF